MNQHRPTHHTTTTDAGRLLTLSEIAAETGISLDDLARYRKLLGDRLPSVEQGDRRRYPRAAVEMFRSFHQQGNGGGGAGGARASSEEDGGGRRRLLSLAAQRRHREEEKRRRQEELAREPVVDPGPPDPMIAALEAMSGIEEEPGTETSGETAEAAAEGLAAEPTADTGPAARGTAAESTATESTPAESPEEPAEARTEAAETRGEAPRFRWPEPEPETDTGDDSEPATETEEPARVVVRRPEPPPQRRAPARPSRPVYTLQEVHERTGIPYAKLALYAATHADQIPSVGERRSPAYMREGMEAFCRLHALKEPGWEMPELGPERGWDDERGLAARLQALETAQADLADALRGTVRALRRTWTGQATWE